MVDNEDEGVIVPINNQNINANPLKVLHQSKIQTLDKEESKNPQN